MIIQPKNKKPTNQIYNKLELPQVSAVLALNKQLYSEAYPIFWKLAILDFTLSSYLSIYGLQPGAAWMSSLIPVSKLRIDLEIYFALRTRARACGRADDMISALQDGRMGSICLMAASFDDGWSDFAYKLENALCDSRLNLFCSIATDLVNVRDITLEIRLNGHPCTAFDARVDGERLENAVMVASRKVSLLGGPSKGQVVWKGFLKDNIAECSFSRVEDEWR